MDAALKKANGGPVAAAGAEEAGGRVNMTAMKVLTAARVAEHSHLLSRGVGSWNIPADKRLDGGR